MVAWKLVTCISKEGLGNSTYQQPASVNNTKEEMCCDIGDLPYLFAILPIMLIRETTVLLPLLQSGKLSSVKNLTMRSLKKAAEAMNAIVEIRIIPIQS